MFKEELVWGAGQAICSMFGFGFGFGSGVGAVATITGCLESQVYTMMQQFNDEAACKHLAENKGE